MKKIQFSAILDGVNLKKDGTLSLKIGTQELAPSETAEIFELGNKQIYVAMAETEIESLQVPEVLPEMQGDKTPSQRLRNVLYLIWENKTDKKQTFPRFYEDYVFKLVENLKAKLE